MQAQSRSEAESAWEESVSAWVDGEDDIRPEDLDTPYGRQGWDTYHLIGDVMRSRDLAVQPSEMFYARLSRAIDDEPPIVAPRRSFRHSAAARVGLSGLAVAAAVAAVVWVALPQFGVSGTGAAPTQVLASSDDASLSDYVSAHREFAGVNPVRQVSFESGVAGQ